MSQKLKELSLFFYPLGCSCLQEVDIYKNTTGNQITLEIRPQDPEWGRNVSGSSKAAFFLVIIWKMEVFLFDYELFKRIQTHSPQG